MAKAQDSTIRLLRPWRGRTIGSIIPGLEFGVAELLVSRRYAEWAPGLAAQGTPLGQPPSLTGAPPAVPSVPPTQAVAAAAVTPVQQPPQQQQHKHKGRR